MLIAKYRFRNFEMATMLSEPEFKATINGNEWIADSVLAIHIADYGPLPNSFEIFAYKNDGSSLFLKTNNDTNSVTTLISFQVLFASMSFLIISTFINLFYRTSKHLISLIILKLLIISVF